jgi:hypothetical protein
VKTGVPVKSKVSQTGKTDPTLASAHTITEPTHSTAVHSPQFTICGEGGGGAPGGGVCVCGGGW